MHQTAGAVLAELAALRAMLSTAGTELSEDLALLARAALRTATTCAQDLHEQVARMPGGPTDPVSVATGQLARALDAVLYDIGSAQALDGLVGLARPDERPALVDHVDRVWSYAMAELERQTPLGYLNATPPIISLLLTTVVTKRGHRSGLLRHGTQLAAWAWQLRQHLQATGVDTHQSDWLTGNVVHKYQADACVPVGTFSTLDDCLQHAACT